MVMTQPIEHLAAAGPFRSADGTTATSEDTPAFGKYCCCIATILYIATILIVATFILVDAVIDNSDGTSSVMVNSTGSGDIESNPEDFTEVRASRQPVWWRRTSTRIWRGVGDRHVISITTPARERSGRVLAGQDAAGVGGNKWQRDKKSVSWEIQ